MTSVTADMIERKKAAADKGDAEACVFMGHLYASDSHGAARDYSKSFHYFTKASELGSGAGAYWLHGLYRFGEGVSEDLEQSFFYLELAASRKFPLACRDLAKHYLRENTPETHKKALMQAQEYMNFALAGHEVIEEDCGMVLAYPVMIGLGIGTARDPKKAYDILYQLAQKGFTEARATLAAQKLEAEELKMTLMLSNYYFDVNLPDVMAQGPVYTAKADVNKVDRDLETKLYKAAVQGNIAEIEKQFGEGADIERTSGMLHLSPLAAAAAAGQLASVQKLIEKGARVNAVCGPLLLTALSQAVLHREKEVVAYLLSKGADVKHRDKSTDAGRTAMDYARDKKDEEIIALLRNAGAM